MFAVRSSSTNPLVRRRARGATPIPHSPRPLFAGAGAATGNAYGAKQSTVYGVNSLPPVAVLATSRGGRLVASGITVTNDQVDGGYNVKLAQTAAREAVEKAQKRKEANGTDQVETIRRLVHMGML